LIAARERFDVALRKAGRGLAPILMHATEGLPVLRARLSTCWSNFTARAGQNGGMMHPAVQRALDAIARQLELVRLDFPGLPQRQQMQIARSRCGHEIAAANVALDLRPPLRPPAGPGRAR
jgi:hypothetical protein